MTGTGTGTGTENPFVQVYNAFWTMAERNTILTSLVRTKNRIKYDNMLGPKINISAGDLPELELLLAGAVGNGMNTSTTCQLVRTYTWVLTTGEFEINQFYNDVAWELYRSMIDWDSVLCGLTWPDDEWHYVTRTQMLNVEEGTIYKGVNRDIRGWAGMWSYEVEMHFRTTDLRI